jgi:hypothetical protein
LPSVPEYWRALAVLGEAGVVEHPRLDLDLGRHPLRHRAHHRRRVPGAVGQELLQALIVGLLAQPLDHRLKRLALTLLDQPAQIEAAACHLHRPVHRLREHVGPERLQTLLDRRRPIDIRCRHCRHHASSRREPQTRGGFAGPATNPTAELTKHY